MHVGVVCESRVNINMVCESTWAVIGFDDTLSLARVFTSACQYKHRYEYDCMGVGV